MVLLGGQGIWYPAPTFPRELAPPSRSSLDTGGDSSRAERSAGSLKDSWENWSIPSHGAIEDISAQRDANLRASRENTRVQLRAQLKSSIGVDRDR